MANQISISLQRWPLSYLNLTKYHLDTLSQFKLWHCILIESAEMICASGLMLMCIFIGAQYTSLGIISSYIETCFKLFKPLHKKNLSRWLYTGCIHYDHNFGSIDQDNTDFEDCSCYLSKILM